MHTYQVDFITIGFRFLQHVRNNSRFCIVKQIFRIILLLFHHGHVLKINISGGGCVLAQLDLWSGWGDQWISDSAILSTCIRIPTQLTDFTVRIPTQLTDFTIRILTHLWYLFQCKNPHSPYLFHYQNPHTSVYRQNPHSPQFPVRNPSFQFTVRIPTHLNLLSQSLLTTYFTVRISTHHLFHCQNLHSPFHYQNPHSAHLFHCQNLSPYTNKSYPYHF